MKEREICETESKEQGRSKWQFLLLVMLSASSGLQLLEQGREILILSDSRLSWDDGSELKW
jgi:hypothetical protein